MIAIKGAVLTGIGYPNATDPQTVYGHFILEVFTTRIAKTVDKKWSNRDTGYVMFGDIYAHVNGFLKAPNYDIPTAEYAQSIAQPSAILEFYSGGMLNLNASAFKGPVMVTAGEYDLGNCGGQCYDTYTSGVAENIFKGSKALELYVHPGAGHGINFNKNATGSYESITSFLDRNF